MSTWEYTETELWRCGEKGTAIQHVFGLTAHGRTVIAFCEARYGDGGDAGCVHDLWMRRSLDGGRTFLPTVVLCPSGQKHTWTNPVPVWDQETGRLFLFYSDNLGNCQTDNYLMYSDDLGETWSPPRRINALLEQGGAPPFHLAGPGHGIQLKRGPHAGRLIIPFWHRSFGPERPAKERGYCVSALISGDHGATFWQTTPMARGCLGNESRIAETRDDLIWVIRPIKPCRFISRSADGGETWDVPSAMPLGPANNCDAGVESLPGENGGEDLLLVSRISMLEKRRDMEILISADGGRTFTGRMALPAGDAMPGYSDLCVIREDEPVVGLLHCRSSHVLFSRISMDALTGGRSEGVARSVWL